MNKMFIGILCFGAGLATGLALTRKIEKNAYEKKMEQEIKEIQDLYAETFRGKGYEAAIAVKQNLEKASIKEYIEQNKIPTDYTHYQEKIQVIKESEDDTVIEYPYIIRPDQFGELDDHDLYSFNYYSDGILTNENDEELDEYDEIIGSDALNHFGEYEEDVVYVRNNTLKCDYEILRDLNPFYKNDERKPHDIGE